MPTRSTTPARSTSKTQIVEMLKADHKKVKKAFKEFEKLDPREDAEACEALVEQTCDDLEVHAELEEQVFYPAAREAVKDVDLLDEAEVEHMTAKVLIGQLRGMSAQDDKFAATFKVLGEYINHHVEEEEGQIFRQLGSSAAEWDTVLERMQQRRAELMEEKGLPAEQAAAPARPGKARSRPAAGRGRKGAAEARPQAAGGRSTGSDGDEE